MQLPLISVLIPTFNVEPFVEQAIRSVMDQTYRNLEIIVVDDCSTDKTYSILQSLSKEDSRIRLFRNESNKRIVDTLNFAFRQSSGELIARMDGDDVSLPHRLEAQFGYLTSNPSFDLVGLSYIIIDEAGFEIQKEKHLTDFEKIKKATKYVSPVPHFWLAKREVYDLVGPYRIPGAEDYDFILRAIDKGCEVSNVPEFLYLHRIRSGNTATANGLIQKKSFHYVKKLHRERISNAEKRDSYSEQNLVKKIQSTGFEKFSYRLACGFNHKFILNKRNRMLSLSYLLLAVFFSPRFLLFEKYSRFRYRKLLSR